MVLAPMTPMVRRCRSRTPVALSPILILCLCLLWHTIQTWFGDGSNFSLMAPKSYRGIVATPSHHHRITLNMFLHDVAIIMLFAAVGYAAAYSQQRWLAMPHAVEEFAPGPPSPQHGALLAAGLYGANIAYNVINKRVLLAHPHPCLVTGINLCSSSLCCVVCWMLGLIHWPRFLGWSFYVKLLGLAVLHWSGMLFSNISVSEVHISFTHTVKAAEPFFTALFTAVLIGHKPTLRAWLSLLVVIAGIVVASTAEISFTWRGFWAAMASNVVVALRTVLTKMAMDRHILDPLNFQALLQCAAFLVSIPVALMFNLHAVREVAADTAAWPSIVLIGPLVWTFNVASIMILVHTSTVVHSMIRSMRRPLLVLASIITFGTRITELNALGILFTLFGAFWYRYESELSEDKKNGHHLKRATSETRETRQRSIP